MPPQGVDEGALLGAVTFLEGAPRGSPTRLRTRFGYGVGEGLAPPRWLLKRRRGGTLGRPRSSYGIRSRVSLRPIK